MPTQKFSDAPISARFRLHAYGFDTSQNNFRILLLFCCFAMKLLSFLSIFITVVLGLYPELEENRGFYLVGKNLNRLRIIDK